MSRRAENRARTEQALADAAIQQFSTTDHGDVTMESIAAAAGVSRRTAYRYAATKHDLLLHQPNQWREVFRNTLDSAEGSLVDMLRAASLAVVDHIEHDPEPVRRLYGALGRNPELAMVAVVDNRRWIALIAEAINVGLRPPDQDEEADRGRRDRDRTNRNVQAGILASALMGMIEQVYLAWVETDTPMGPLIDLGFELLEPAFARAQAG